MLNLLICSIQHVHIAIITGRNVVYPLVYLDSMMLHSYTHVQLYMFTYLNYLTVIEVCFGSYKP